MRMPCRLHVNRPQRAAAFLYALYAGARFFQSRFYPRAAISAAYRRSPWKADVSMMSVENSEQPTDPVSQALLPAAAVVCVAMLALSLWATAADPGSRATDALIESLHACAANTEQATRLSCYDKALAAAHPARGANAPVLVHPRP